MFISILLGGGHQPEPKCHLDLKSNFIIQGGSTSEVHSHLLQLFQSWGGGVHWKFTLTCFNFSNPGGEVHQKFTLTCFNFSNPGGGVHWKFTLTCFNFSNPGGEVHQKFTLTCFNFSNPGGVYIRSLP